ncbi:MAG TPA: AAA family ATPase [Candidatus Limnocylindrales bacterium]|nr:AAA family ATPase [Candidatus Limnocylindrales bacterium]
MRQIYLAATGQNRGKTTVALGLLAALIDRGLETGFIKPVGQRYGFVDGAPIDEDAILMRSVFGLPDPPAALSPVHIPRGFTKAFISGKVVEDLPTRIVAAHERVSRGREVVLIEGTGHAGVGAVIGLSNADVAAMLGARALIVSEAGVGRPIDEIVLNRALFARHGVEVVGAVVNKVDHEAHPTLAGVLERGLARHGIELLGVLPYRPLLSNPTLEMLIEQLPGELLSEGPDLGRVIEHVAIGAMQPGHVLQRIGPGSLLIVPGDREDVVEAAVAATLAARVGVPPGTVDATGEGEPRFGRRGSDEAATDPAGIVLTGGYRPGPAALEGIRRARLFAYLVAQDTYAAASEVHDLLVKTHPDDAEKIALTKALVAEHLEVERILDRFAAPAPAHD